MQFLCNFYDAKNVEKNLTEMFLCDLQGGAIAVNCGIQYPNLFDGVVLLSPGLAIDKKFDTKVLRFLGRTMAKIAPGAGLIQLKADAITSDQDIASFSSFFIMPTLNINMKKKIFKLKIFFLIKKNFYFSFYRLTSTVRIR